MLSRPLSSRCAFSALALCFAALLLFFDAPAARAQAGPADAPESCQFASEKRLDLDSSTLVGSGDPVLGNPEADLTLVEFFDPNCAHCARFHPVMKEVMRKYGDRAKLYMHPFPLWKYSLPQIQAMLLAGEQGKYYDMIDAQMQTLYRDGMSRARLGALADSLGMARAPFVQALREGRKAKAVLALHRQGRRAGVESTPTLAIGERVVAPASRTAGCIGQLIEEELAGRE
jgi:protein-disulfide isomerase